MTINNFSEAFYRLHRTCFTEDIRETVFIKQFPDMFNAEIRIILMEQMRGYYGLQKAGNRNTYGINKGDELEGDYIIWVTVEVPEIPGRSLKITYYFSPAQNSYEVRNHSAKGIKAYDPYFLKPLMNISSFVFNSCITFEEEDDREIQL